MALSIADLLGALPEVDEAATHRRVDELLKQLSRKPVPTGPWTRFWVLGSLQAKVAAGYFAYWVRSSFRARDEQERLLNETHLAAAIKLLGGMGYLRGAIMKVGQVLGTYPDIVPQQVAEVMTSLHFDAPPMHFSLLREQFRGELGREPEEVFSEFDEHAAAAASLGQVHRARLKSGQEVAVKIQYPSIAETIRADLRSFQALLLPMRLSRDWDNYRELIDEVIRVLEWETDYEKEAGFLEMARALFSEDEGIVVPRVQRAYSTRRVLTMDWLDGVHLDAFLDTRPDSASRDLQGERMLLAAMRLYYQAKVIYADPHPGNYLFLPDGRLGLLDFGCCRPMTEAELSFQRQMHDVFPGDDRERLREAVIRSADLEAFWQRETDRIERLSEAADWLWEPLREDAPFDFGRDEYLQHGIQLYGELGRKRYLRSLPINLWSNRQFLGLRALLYRLGARVNMRRLFDRERARGGWC